MINDLPGLPKMPHHEIHPGQQYACAGTELISTLLGSCVAACLYDPVAGVAGMNHFLLANRRYSRSMPLTQSEAGRYGVNAMELLINQLLHLGADRRRLHAKVFGGGTVLTTLSRDNFLCVGEVNGRFIREFLKDEGIPIESEDLGGKQGRVIKFRTDTFTVYRRFIRPAGTALIELQEHGYWQKAITAHTKEEEKIILFK
jgi:Chemotaxis protein; stimulates methylation of MCP proteins